MLETPKEPLAHTSAGWCGRGAGGRVGWAGTQQRRWLRSALCALECSVALCCVHIFHFVSSDTFRVKKSPKRSPLSDPPSQVYCSLDTYDFISQAGVEADEFVPHQCGCVASTLSLPPPWSASRVFAGRPLTPSLCWEVSMCPRIPTSTRA